MKYINLMYINLMLMYMHIQLLVTIILYFTVTLTIKLIYTRQKISNNWWDTKKGDQKEAGTKNKDNVLT